MIPAARGPSEAETEYQSCRQQWSRVCLHLGRQAAGQAASQGSPGCGCLDTEAQCSSTGGASRQRSYHQGPVDGGHRQAEPAEPRPAAGAGSKIMHNWLALLDPARNISMHETYGSSNPSPAENQHGPGMDRAASATQGLRLFDSIRAAFHMVADSRPSPFIDAGLRGFTPKDAAEALQLLEHAHSLVTRGAHPGSDYGAVEQYLDPQVNPRCPFWAHMNLYGHIERLLQELKHARKQDKSLRGKGEAPGIAAGHSTISHIKAVEMQRGLKPMRRNINIVSALVDLARIGTLDASSCHPPDCADLCCTELS